MSADKHLTIPGALEWDSGSVERFTIETLRYAGGSEHDVRYVSERDYDAALSREAALREELDRTKKAYEVYGIDFDRSEEKDEALQQRLTVAEQLLSRALQYGGMTPDWRDSVEEALKTDAEGEES